MENKDISHLRKSYDKSKLNLTDINFQPMEFFKLWFEDALKNKNIEEKKIKEDIKNNLKNKVLKKSEKKSKNNKITSDKNISFQNREYKPKSYKIIFILKDVDPKDPTEDLRTILRNSDVNFEIEKIERYFDPKNKTIKSN